MRRNRDPYESQYRESYNQNDGGQGPHDEKFYDRAYRHGWGNDSNPREGRNYDEQTARHSRGLLHTDRYPNNQNTGRYQGLYERPREHSQYRERPAGAYGRAEYHNAYRNEHYAQGQEHPFYSQNRYEERRSRDFQPQPAYRNPGNDWAYEQEVGGYRKDIEMDLRQRRSGASFDQSYEQRPGEANYGSRFYDHPNHSRRDEYQAHRRQRPEWKRY